MKYLSPSELEELLKIHEPDQLLQMFEGRLDAQGRKRLVDAHAEEAKADAQLKDMSSIFTEALPPVPELPWKEAQITVGSKSSQWALPLWSAFAAAVLLSFVGIWYASSSWTSIGSQMRQLPSPAEFELLQQRLAAEWITLAKQLIEQGNLAVDNQDSFFQMAQFYLDAAIRLESRHPSQQAEIAQLRKTLFQPDEPPNTKAPADTWRFDKSPPTTFLQSARILHQGVTIQDESFGKTSRSLTDTYLEIASQFTTQAQLEKNKHRAKIANQWGSFFLELAHLANPDRSLILIRWLRVKELLGEVEEAKILNDRLNNLMNQD